MKIFHPTIEINQLLKTVRAKAANGFTISEFSEIMFEVLRLTISAVDSLPVDGAERKVLVLDYISEVFDEFADRVIPLWLFPIWILIQPAIKNLTLAISSGVIEKLLPVVRNQK